MGRHQTSSGRARIALGALPLVATVGAIGVGSVVMSPASSDVPLEPPSGVGSAGGAGTPATSVPFGSGLPPAPVTVLDLAATNGAVAPVQAVPGRATGGAGAGGSAGADASGAGRATGSGATAGGGEAARVMSIRDAAAAAPARGGSSGGGSGAAAAGGGGSDDAGSGARVGGSGGAGAGSSGGSGSGGSEDPDTSGGSRGGLLGGVVDGLGSTVNSTNSLLSFGEASPSVLSFD